MQNTRDAKQGRWEAAPTNDFIASSTVPKETFAKEREGPPTPSARAGAQYSKDTDADPNQEILLIPPDGPRSAKRVKVFNRRAEN